MNVRKAEQFLADVELQYQWYAEHAGWEVAERYLAAVETTCALIGRRPLLGPRAALPHPSLAAWRFFVVVRPFRRHLIFYEIADGAVILRRALHGQRDLPRRLLDPPVAD
jgi:plasmid stabilization system protein ParE